MAAAFVSSFASLKRSGCTAEGGWTVRSLPNEELNPIFGAVADATEEAIVNALVAAEDMVGVRGNFVPRLPHAETRQILAKYNRLVG